MRFFAELETVCATAVERAFALAFPSALEPVQIARKLVAAFEAGTTSGERTGRRYLVRMSVTDYMRLQPTLPYLERQWSAMLARLAERSGRPQRAPDVTAEAAAAMPTGTVAIVTESMPVPQALVLRVRRGLPHAAAIALGSEPIVVGRDPACAFVLGDPSVSRRHLEIVPDGGGFRFRDLGSSNGTRHNGVSRRDGVLDLGDVFGLGDSELTVEPRSDGA